jgi:hypothetical protein
VTDHQQHMAAMTYNACRWVYTMDRSHAWADPAAVRWTRAAAAAIADNEDHLRELVKRHCL